MKSEGYYMEKLNIEDVENVAGGAAYDDFDLEGDSDSDDMENFGNDYYGFIDSTSMRDVTTNPHAKKEKGATSKIKKIR